MLTSMLAAHRETSRGVSLPQPAEKRVVGIASSRRSVHSDTPVVGIGSLVVHVFVAGSYPPALQALCSPALPPTAEKLPADGDPLSEVLRAVGIGANAVQGFGSGS
jgi:hypothetical protein